MNYKKVVRGLKTKCSETSDIFGEYAVLTASDPEMQDDNAETLMDLIKQYLPDIGKVLQHAIVELERIAEGRAALSGKVSMLERKMKNDAESSRNKKVVGIVATGVLVTIATGGVAAVAATKTAAASAATAAATATTVGIACGAAAVHPCIFQQMPNSRAPSKT